MGGVNKILFFILMLFFSSIALISYFQNRQVEPLFGASTKVDKPNFNWSNWFDGTFQEKMDKRTNSHFFIRSILIKVRNQIDYSLFGKLNASDVVIGKDKVLFEEVYIESYLGMNYIGEEIIDSELSKVKLMQDTLASMNKKLLVVITASKADYFPDKFPEKYDTIAKQTTNYDTFTKQLKEKEINHLDFNKMFLEMKDTVSYPLFSKGGIHWSQSSKLFVWNTIVDKLEEDSDWKLARLQSSNVEWSTPKHRDKDLYDLLNIYTFSDESKMAYHDYTIDTTGIDRPLGMVVGDSFFWGLLDLGFAREVLNNGQFWYYNNTIYPSENGINYQSTDYDILSTLFAKDIVILLSNPSNLKVFPFGFNSEYMKAITTPPSARDIRDKEVKRLVKRIRKNKDWFSHIVNKSSTSGIDLDSILYKEADYFLEQAAIKKENKNK